MGFQIEAGLITLLVNQANDPISQSEAELEASIWKSVWALTNFYTLKCRNYFETFKDGKTIFVIFISVLIDLLGFTVILPLFPSLFEYYETTSGDGLYLTIKTAIENFRSWLLIPPSEPVTSVLFGGLIGSLFSFLQFINSPILGALSGKYLIVNLKR